MANAMNVRNEVTVLITLNGETIELPVEDARWLRDALTSQLKSVGRE